MVELPVFEERFRCIDMTNRAKPTRNLYMQGRLKRKASKATAAQNFLAYNLKEAYRERQNMCVVSDTNPSIIKAVSDVYNDVPHYAFYRGWTLISNIVESINGVLVSARELPIYDFLEEVRLLFAKWNCKNRQQASYTFTPLIEKFNDILKENEALCTHMTVVPAIEYVYTVHDKQKYFIVCLKEKNLMNAFQLDQIPCAHACAVLEKKNFEKGPYCCDLFKPKTVSKTYDIPIYPLPHKDDWLIPESVLGEIVLPPKYERPLGRPAKKDCGKSGRDMFRKKNINSCDVCGAKVHNRRSCRKYRK
ncbi:uncharacterized protein LOC124887138 [Capsicum annuum]|uniref:uncharacterized protein LOC124887138 n=1 Tax=Capsicum annuum TaxID=4072 RepID=UPI001FB05F61|nr:uncharacterized protein LOC124887138 [Capsicum annuum]